MDPKTNRGFDWGFLALWSITSATAWGFGAPFIAVISIWTAPQILDWVVIIGLSGLLSGLILGVGQSVLLRGRILRSGVWGVITAASIPLGLILGFLLVVAYISFGAERAGIGALGDGVTFFTPSPPLMLLFTGLVQGLGQVLMARPNFASTPARSLLWVLGSMAALAGSWMLSMSLGSLMDLGHVEGAMIMGMVGGLATGAIYLLLQAQKLQSR